MIKHVVFQIVTTCVLLAVGAQPAAAASNDNSASCEELRDLYNALDCSDPIYDYDPLCTSIGELIAQNCRSHGGGKNGHDIWNETGGSTTGQQIFRETFGGLGSVGSDND